MVALAAIALTPDSFLNHIHTAAHHSTATLPSQMCQRAWYHSNYANHKHANYGVPLPQGLRVQMLGRMRLCYNTS